MGKIKQWENDWQPASRRVQQIGDRHHISPKLGADAQILLDEMTDLLLSAERSGFETAIDLLREQCMVNSNKPEMVVILRSIETILMERRRIVYDAQGKPVELFLSPP